ncbi:rCG36667 [Rattus norvegicus]|uniref:RCG36667 n=1 Tax=Rattus norvegicus TaxID=10116 RepID=A6JRV8_RAT|nr:rCG36667 [Rattus norvegicus]
MQRGLMKAQKAEEAWPSPGLECSSIRSLFPQQERDGLWGWGGVVVVVAGV